MDIIDSRTPLPQQITDLITRKAQRLMGHYRFTESDQDDIVQTITFDVLRKRSRVNATRAQDMAFLICLVEHAVADLIAARKAACRDYRREEGALDQWQKDPFGDWALRGEMFTEEDAGRRVGWPSSSQEDRRDLLIDMSEAVSKLSPRDREIFEQYAALRSARAVGKAMDLHHSTVCDALAQIKEHFQKSGLEAYLPKPRKSDPTR